MTDSHSPPEGAVEAGTDSLYSVHMGAEEEEYRREEAVAVLTAAHKAGEIVWPAELAAEKARVDEAVALLREAAEVVRKFHEWLERHDSLTAPDTLGGPRRGYIGLDHEVGENVEGCGGCAFLATQEDRTLDV